MFLSMLQICSRNGWHLRATTTPVVRSLHIPKNIGWLVGCRHELSFSCRPIAVDVTAILLDRLLVSRSQKGKSLRTKKILKISKWLMADSNKQLNNEILYWTNKYIIGKTVQHCWIVSYFFLFKILPNGNGLC